MDLTKGKTQPKWRTLARERRNQNGGLSNKETKIRNGLDERKDATKMADFQTKKPKCKDLWAATFRVDVEQLTSVLISALASV